MRWEAKEVLSQADHMFTGSLILGCIWMLPFIQIANLASLVVYGWPPAQTNRLIQASIRFSFAAIMKQKHIWTEKKEGSDRLPPNAGAVLGCKAGPRAKDMMLLCKIRYHTVTYKLEYILSYMLIHTRDLYSVVGNAYQEAHGRLIYYQESRGRASDCRRWA